MRTRISQKEALVVAAEGVAFMQRGGGFLFFSCKMVTAEHSSVTGRTAMLSSRIKNKMPME